VTDIGEATVTVRGADRDDGNLSLTEVSTVPANVIGPPVIVADPDNEIPVPPADPGHAPVGWVNPRLTLSVLVSLNVSPGPGKVLLTGPRTVDGL
jgi:hypothetical protein